MAGLEQGLPRQALHDEPRSAEQGGVRAREEDAGSRIAETGEGILGHALSQHAGGIVLRAEQSQDQGSRERRRRVSQAKGKDPGVEAPGDRSEGLLELEAAIIEPRAQTVEQIRGKIPAPVHSRTRAPPEDAPSLSDLLVHELDDPLDRLRRSGRARLPDDEPLRLALEELQLERAARL